MSTVEETIKTLVEMGFSEEKAKKGLNKTGWAGVEQAMEWILAHNDDDDDDDEEEMAQDGGPKEPPKPLTPEEREAQMKALEELRAVKRKEREEREQKEALEREKKRIEDGKKMTDIKQEMADKEIVRMAEERRREKLETLAARERVKVQIQADRDRKKREMQGHSGAAAPPASPHRPVQVAAPTRSYDEAKIQVRLTNGKTLVQTFKSKEPLSAVRLYIQLHRDDVHVPNQPVKLMTNFPKKVFTEEDYEKPLDMLGLVPAAAVIVMK